MSEESLIRSVLEAYLFADCRERVAQYFKHLSDVAEYIKLLYAD